MTKSLSELDKLGRPKEPKRHRPAIPDSVVLEAALLYGLPCHCGCGRLIRGKENLRRDHRPPLASREYDPKTRKYEPDANDPKHIQLLLPEHHDTRTFGTPATTQGSDIHNEAHIRRLSKKHEDHQEKMRKKSGL